MKHIAMIKVDAHYYDSDYGDGYNYYAAQSITEWEEISDEDYEVLSRLKQYPLDDGTGNTFIMVCLERAQNQTLTIQWCLDKVRQKIQEDMKAAEAKIKQREQQKLHDLQYKQSEIKRLSTAVEALQKELENEKGI